LTTGRSSFIDPEIIIEELKQSISKIQYLDYITFSGSGEPTLNKDLGLIIDKIKQLTATPVAVLTNGTLLYLAEVREDLALSDLVLPSLDAVSAEVFAKINQPAGDLDINVIIGGMVKFRQEYRGQTWLEVFIVEDINDGGDELDKLYDAITKIKPDKVQLNSLDRPPAYAGVKAVDAAKLEQIAARWGNGPVRVEVIQRVRQRREILSFSKNLENNILNTIRRRPLMIEDLEAITGRKRCEILKYIDVLEKEKKIAAKIVDDKIFYAPRS
jgi:wyosine [tRNA(Phe)-imidazoG37] synthetase (radical SAM superfamily)